MGETVCAEARKAREHNARKTALIQAIRRIDKEKKRQEAALKQAVIKANITSESISPAAKEVQVVQRHGLLKEKKRRQNHGAFERANRNRRRKRLAKQAAALE